MKGAFRNNMNNVVTKVSHFLELIRKLEAVEIEIKPYDAIRMRKFPRVGLWDGIIYCGMG